MIAPPAHNDAHSDGDSDSDWDDDDDFGTRKINIKIKPIAQVTPSKISASVDELRATVGTWKSLANINLVKPNSRRHHQSTIQLNNVDKEPRRPNSILSPQISANPMIIPDKMMFTPLAQNSNGLNFQNNGFNNDRQQVHTTDCDSIIPNGDNLRNPMLATNQPSVPRDFGDYIGLGSPTFESDANNLDIQLKSSSSSMLSPGLFSAFKRVTTSDNTILPVAFAVQECLNVNSQINPSYNDSCSIIGSIKMAVPAVMFGIDASKLEDNLVFDLVTHARLNRIRLNTEFVSEISDAARAHTMSDDLVKRLSVDMKAVHSYVMKLNRNQSSPKYIVLPELLKYSIRSQDKKDELPHEISPLVARNPLQVVAHWLCDLDITKVRVDVELLSNLDGGSFLTTDDVKNLKISMHVNGNVSSYQSKPDSNWNPLDAKLTWSFANLTELIQKSTQKGVTSCLARFNLIDGPSTPSDIMIQFSVTGKTISGSHIRVNNPDKFRLATQKFEVRTGTFKCQPPCL